MTTSSSEELDRNTSGRFVRNLALSLSGGALLTLLGAGVAHADDGAAGTASDGQGAAGTGDATAVGNQSGTNTTQTVTVSGNLGVIQVINQQANVNNVGVGVANTGGNIAIGNASQNGANTNQNSDGGATGSASNNGDAANSSNGGALINTGNASAIGNQSNTSLLQEAHGSAHGELGGILVINQDARVNNVGLAVANTGANLAVGNGSRNEAGLLQDAQADGSLANNNGAATNDSNGKATINTGGAGATGNKSTTNVVQKASGSAGGELGGLMIIDQDAFVLNAGAAVANTGGNLAAGNVSDNLALGAQGASSNDDSDIGVTSNSGEASNASDGDAYIGTGKANAIGNESTTGVTQLADATITGFGGGSVISQDSNVVNAGLGIANSGLNAAVGNVSTNAAGIEQTASGEGFDNIGIVGNFGKAANASDGTGTVHSGNAWAAGNKSSTDTRQEAVANGGAFNVQTQGDVVVNAGLGLSNSGLNASIGNLSQNGASVDQDADIDEDGDLDAGVAVIGQFGLAENTSDGTAEIHTGDAYAIGNDSKTELSQKIDPTGVAVQTQVAAVANVGVGISNSGGNLAIGNASLNDVGVGPELPFGEPLLIQAEADEFADIDGLTMLPGDEPTILDQAIWAAQAFFAPYLGEAADELAPYLEALGLDEAPSPEQLQWMLQEAIQQYLGDYLPQGGLPPLDEETIADLLADFRDTFRPSGEELYEEAAFPHSTNGDVEAQADDNASLDQDGELDVEGQVTVGTLALANNGEASNTSDGTAGISTGNTWSTGNHSTTVLAQESNAGIEGLGTVVNTQVGGVANVGLGLANSGGNIALGNVSQSDARGEQDADIIGDGDLTAGVLALSQSGTASNASDGSASITTGDAVGLGNNSVTSLAQSADGQVDGLGLVVNTQVGGVLNAGAGIANSGLNAAVGNASNNEASLDQNIDVDTDDDGDLTAGVLTLSNSGEATNASDGTAEVTTGKAEGTGNTSETHQSQDLDGNVDGLGSVVNTQLGGVANLGLGVANSGVNAAVGNVSNNFAGDENGDLGLDQDIQLGDSDESISAPIITLSNAGTASNTSDGLGSIKTGGAQGQGNVSATNLGQYAAGTVGEDGIGIVPNVQVAGVVNAGAGIANSGVNLAVGNAAGTLPGDLNTAELDQDVDIVDDQGDDLDVIGPLTGTNSGEASNTSDGTAKVHTGGALASGNVSASNLHQNLDGDVDGLGLVVAPQIGGIANVGVGVANSGVNASFGNLSSNVAEATQVSTFDPDDDTTVVGPLTVGNNGEATNASDGEACSCTGNAVASGNVSTSTLTQDMEIGVEDGLSVVPTTGFILNAGFGLANSGVNLAVGNISGNTALTTQTTNLDPGADTTLIGAQTFVNGGGAENASNGTGKVGTGNASATGNISTSDLVQAASVDGAGAFAAINGGITNAGAGLANSGINLGVGNASTNTAILDQAAEGVGTVTNNGKASNASDGFGGVGDPDCDDVTETPGTPGTPGGKSLPKTGGPLEVEAAIGLMLVLAGFGFRRASKRLV